ncbi:MAG: SU10 major capsid protein [Cetobacterium sp.]
MKKTMGLLNGEILDLKEEIQVCTNANQTPIFNFLASKGVSKATAVSVSWREEVLDSTEILGAVEGAEAGAVSESTRTLVENNCMILSKVAEVSGTLEALDVAGVGSELKRSINQRLQELKINAERYILTGAKANESGATPRQMNGLLNLVGVTVDATTGFKLSHIENALMQMWEKGGANGNLVLFCKPSVKELITAVYKGRGTTFIQEGTQTMGLVVTNIITDYGNVSIVIHPHMVDETALILNMDLAEMSELRGAYAQDLAKKGDSDKVQLIWEGTVKLYNKFGGAKIIGIKATV